MVLGVSAFRALRNNAVIKADLAGSGGVRMTIDKLRDMLMVRTSTSASHDGL
jgi:hypothetical protein